MNVLCMCEFMSPEVGGFNSLNRNLLLPQFETHLYSFCDSFTSKFSPFRFEDPLSLLYICMLFCTIQLLNSREMANPQTVEMEAAEFLHKLVQESKDEPTELVAKLFGNLQQMRSSGKENSVPYQVISRAMETVMREHNLDIQTLMPSHLPLATCGSSQPVRVSEESKPSFSGNEIVHPDQYDSTTVLVPGTSEHDPYQELPNQTPFGNSPYDIHDFTAKMAKDRSMEVCTPLPQPSMDHIAGIVIVNASQAVEGSGGGLPRDTGKSSVSYTSDGCFRFKDEQLKQLRAQSIVFLAFRNGKIPRKLHLEIALGNFQFQEEVAGEGEMQTSTVPQMPQQWAVEGTPPSRRGRGRRRPRRVPIAISPPQPSSKVDTISSLPGPDSVATFRSVHESMDRVGQPVTPSSQPSLSCATPESCHVVRDDDFSSLSLEHPSIKE